MDIINLFQATCSAFFGHWPQVASLRFEASQDLTYGNGCHSLRGGPVKEININELKCEANKRERKGVHTRFILLKPLSHSVVLTGIVFTRLHNDCNELHFQIPPFSLKMRKGTLTSEKITPNLPQIHLKSSWPYSDDISEGQVLGSRVNRRQDRLHGWHSFMRWLGHRLQYFER